MRILISESQLKKIVSEQTAPFYRKNGDVYSFIQGGPIAKKQGDINASDLFRQGVPKGGYPQKLSAKEVMGRLNSQSVFGSPNLSYGTKNAVQGKPSFPPPSDWQSEEENYSVFNEPLGKIDKSVVGNYRGKRGLIPPQTNKYFWDPESLGTTKQQVIYSNGKTGEKTIQTKGGWVVKSVSNVDKWRNVPAGYHPDEYPQALEWEKNNFIQPKRKLARDAESTAVNISKQRISAKINPFYQKDFPLGLTQDMVAQKNLEVGDANRRYRYEEPKAPQGSDTIWEITKGDRKAIRTHLMQQQQEALEKINNSYGYFKKEIDNEDDEIPMWFKVLQYSLYLIPYTAAYASEINGLIELAFAAKHLSDGKPGKAASEAFFGILPFTGLKAILQNANALNALKHLAEKRALSKIEAEALKELSQMPAYHPAKVVSEINMGMEKIINQLLPKAMQTSAIQVSKNLSKKMVSDLEKQVGAYGVVKLASTFLY